MTRTRSIGISSRRASRSQSRPLHRSARSMFMAAGAVLAITLSGCSASEPGAAAVIDGRRISENDVQQATADMQEFTGQPIAARDMLNFLIYRPYFADAAARGGVGVSLDDAEAAMRGRISDPSQAAAEVLQANEALNQLTQLPEDRAKPLIDEIGAKLREADIEINPRYGEFNRENISVQPLEPGWIAPKAAP